VKFKAFLLLITVLFGAGAWAQMAPPKPGPELKKLDYFLGTWTTEGTVAQGPWGAGGKFSITDSSEWSLGNFYVQGHGEFKMPPEVGGDGKEVSWMGYDTNENVYTRDGFNDQGQHETSKGTLSGDTWTWNSSQVYGGQEIKQRMTIKVVSPTSYTMKFEVSIDGTNWMTFMDGKATKK
jgi:hypothetical protein